ncbi:uncharacterized protein LY79DRAFT_212571 [Colletotrichum navitas]|uniref:Uncharacterized protein n=1 Tax=Colletotrichum navitas TaxID=681940 RepID=A0AAD8V379_9PEZI|nr:uncharacterized protein LY79DRAFT_212571 [Colletotrichum navitas]KAK1590535.1 hypothetical protein LY79DRAFT_212571 [Colletotrichum navitas]
MTALSAPVSSQWMVDDCLHPAMFLCGTESSTTTRFLPPSIPPPFLVWCIQQLRPLHSTPNILAPKVDRRAVFSFLFVEHLDREQQEGGVSLRIVLNFLCPLPSYLNAASARRRSARHMDKCIVCSDCIEQQTHSSGGYNICSTTWPEAGKRTLFILVISLRRRRARCRSGRSIVYVQYDGVGCSATICIIHAAQQDDGFICASKTFI